MSTFLNQLAYIRLRPLCILHLPQMSDDIYNSSTIASQLALGQIPEYVVTHPGLSQYSKSGGGTSACGLAALNCARIVLGLHLTVPGTTQIVHELMNCRLLEVCLLALVVSFFSAPLSDHILFRISYDRV